MVHVGATIFNFCVLHKHADDELIAFKNKQTGTVELLIPKLCTNEQTDGPGLIQNAANLFCSDMRDIFDSYFQLPHAHR